MQTNHNIQIPRNTSVEVSSFIDQDGDETFYAELSTTDSDIVWRGFSVVDANSAALLARNNYYEAVRYNDGDDFNNTSDDIPTDDEMIEEDIF